MNEDTITDAELEIMKVLWRHNRSTANEIINYVQENETWNAKTIRTYINRLVTKEVITIDKSDKEYRFSYLISESEYRKHTRKAVADKLFGGSVNAMLLNFLDDADMSKEEIEELRNIIDKYDNRTK